MANSIAPVIKYLTAIAEKVYGHESISAILDTQNVEYTGNLANSKTIKVPRMEVSGLADYSKTNGYSQGDVTLTWVDYTLTKDRGRKFVIDAVDDIDAAGKSLAMLQGTFLRKSVVPEIDAYRFAQYASGAASENKLTAALDKDTIIPALDVAMEKLFEAGVPEENVVLFISPSCYTALKNASDKLRWSQGTVLNRNVLMFDEHPIIKVPSTRFYDSITLGSDGYSKKASTGKDINFLLMDKDAVIQCAKHNPSNLISPDANQTSDGWIYKYRIYHDALVQDGKSVGIYAHTKPLAG